MPRDPELDLLFAAETSELEPLIHDERARGLADAGDQIVAALDAVGRVVDTNKIDDIEISETTEETLGDENYGDSVTDDLSNDREALDIDSANAGPDLRLVGFDPNRAALKNSHIKSLVELARRIVGAASDRHAVRCIQITGIFPSRKAGLRNMAQDRWRIVRAAVREAIHRMWPGLADRIEFASMTRLCESASATHDEDPAARRSVEIKLQVADRSGDVPYPAVVSNGDGDFFWQNERKPEVLRERADADSLTSTTSSIKADLAATTRTSGASNLSDRGYSVVRSTKAPPSRWICSLEIAMESDDADVSHAKYAARLSATGLLISPRHILTAAHCLYTRLNASSMSETECAPASEDPILRAKAVTVFPAWQGDARLFDSHVIRDARRIRSSARWHVSRAANRDFDFGLLTLERSLPIGSWGNPPFMIGAPRDEKLNGRIVCTAGYPQGDAAKMKDGSKQNLSVSGQNPQWVASGTVVSVAANSFEHDLPFRSGQDGSPIWIQQGSECTLVGILTSPQHAVRLTPHVVKILSKWVTEDVYRLAS